MILVLYRINLATFTHDYKRVVGVDSAGQERDWSAGVICLSGQPASSASQVSLCHLPLRSACIICLSGQPASSASQVSLFHLPFRSDMRSANLF